jgi:hypothetical protein
MESKKLLSKAQDLDISVESQCSSEEGIDPGKYIKHIVINSQSTYYTVWHEIIDFLCIISSFIYIHYAAYRHDDASEKTLMLIIESAFWLDFMMNFILDYPDPHNPNQAKINDIGKISTRYVNGKFMEDAIALAPFHMIKLSRNRGYLLYIIKIIRLKRGFGNFNVKEYLHLYKNHKNKKLEHMIENDPINANRTDIDQT